MGSNGCKEFSGDFLGEQSAGVMRNGVRSIP